MSVASRFHEEDHASLSTFVVPRFDAHLVQPQPFTTEDTYWQLILARLETRHALQQLRAQLPRCSPQRAVMPGVLPDLLLQRRAIVQLVRHGGVEALVPYNPAIRPQLVYYAAVKTRLSRPDRRRLAAALGAVEVEQSAWGAELQEFQTRLAV